MIESTHFPFYRLVMERGLNKGEIEDIYRLCNELSFEHEEQKAQGLVIYTDLLTQFAGQLNSKLDIVETVQAMSKQGLYSSLMKDFLALMK
jgi:hypothetical protein